MRKFKNKKGMPSLKTGNFKDEAPSERHVVLKKGRF